MKKAASATKNIEISGKTSGGMALGKIVAVDESGQIFLDYCGNSSGPVPARITALMQRELVGRGNPVGREVLLAFVNNSAAHPVIVDAMYSLIDDIVTVKSPAPQRPQEALVDGKRVVLNADEEVVLQCGEASITLTKAGKVLIQGEYISSSSGGAHKIKGGSIQLN
mgnify:FL=1